MENQQNIMPCDLEAERSIIGAMIIDERAVDDAAEIVEISKKDLILGFILRKL